MLSDTLGGGGHAGMRDAFPVTLVPLLADGGLAFLAVRTYPRDVETTVAAVPELTAPAGRR